MDKFTQTAVEHAVELDTLRAENAKLRKLLERSMGLIGRGMVEGAYKEMVGGEQYANRVWDASKAVLAA